MWDIKQILTSLTFTRAMDTNYHRVGDDSLHHYSLGLPSYSINICLDYFNINLNYW